MQHNLDPKQQNCNHFLYFLLYFPYTHVLSHLYNIATRGCITSNFPYDMTPNSVGSVKVIERITLKDLVDKILRENKLQN
jgi:hypothetical protein